MLAWLVAAMMQVPKDPRRLTVPIAPTVEAAEISTSTIMAFASSTAEKNGLNVPHFMKTIACESNWDKDAIGDAGTSIGVTQLRFPSKDWGISTSTAHDPIASIEIMAAAWKRGEAYRWTCWRELFGG